VWSDDISRPTHKRVASVAGKNHSRCHGRLQEGIEVRETFNVQHVNFINKNDTGNNLSNTLVDVALDDLVDLSS